MKTEEFSVTFVVGEGQPTESQIAEAFSQKGIDRWHGSPQMSCF